MERQITILCKRVQRADKKAACELLQIFYKDIYAYLRRLCGSRADAEDLTQQTFLKVWASFDGFAGRSKFTTWLYRIAYNTFIDWRRNNAAGAQARPDQWWQECIDQNPGPFANIAKRQWAEHIYEVVDQLNDDKKYLVHLHYYQGLSIRETAQVLGIATSTVKYRLREVIKILRKKMCVEENKDLQKKTISLAKGKVT